MARPNLQPIGSELAHHRQSIKGRSALAGLNQAELAKMAGANTSTISAMESKGAKVLGSGIDTIRLVMDALDAAGVEVLNDYGLPGCRLRQPA